MTVQDRPYVMEARPRVHEPEVPPHSTFRLVRGRRVQIITSKLEGAPLYLYACYLSDEKEPFLRLISNPSKDNIADALDKHFHKRKKAAEPKAVEPKEEETA